MKRYLGVKPLLALFLGLSALILIFQNFGSNTGSVTPDGWAGKSWVGYQAWFNAPIDGAGRGFAHWGPNNPLQPGNMTIDMWPDTTEYPASSLQYSGFTLGNGKPAQVYSGFDQGAIDLHFSWMKQYGIDGAFLQWFVVDDFAYRLEVTKRVRLAAEKNSREFVIMFDISGAGATACGPTMVQCLQERWMSAVDAGITNSPSYTKYKGKPLVGVWGIGFSHNSFMTPQDAFNFIEWLKNVAPAKYQATVLGGVSNYWRNQGQGDTDPKDPQVWDMVYAKLDIISPWTVNRYQNDAGAASYIQSTTAADVNLLRSRNQKYLPVVYPGFSWANLKKGARNEVPRRAGQFLWTQARENARLGLTSTYTAMFDEYDEGTAICKTAPTAATAPKEFYTLTLDADGKPLPSDWYLRVSLGISRALKSTDLSGFESATAVVPEAPPKKNSQIAPVLSIMNSILFD